MASAESFATILRQLAERKSPVTSRFQKGAKAKMAGPVHDPAACQSEKSVADSTNAVAIAHNQHLPTSRCAVASRLQKVRSQMRRESTSLVVGEWLKALAAPDDARPPILSP